MRTKKLCTPTILPTSTQWYSFNIFNEHISIPCCVLCGKTFSKKCINPDCTNRLSDKLITQAFVSIADLERLLGIKLSENTSLLLCPNCYTKLHRLCTAQICSSCGATPNQVVNSTVIALIPNLYQSIQRTPLEII